MNNVKSDRLNNQLAKTKVIATAYTIDPYRGSEAGMGWNFSLAIAKNAELEVWTRKNNRKNIQRYILEHPQHYSKAIKFKYFDLPKCVLCAKKRLGVAGSQSYYLLWNLFVALEIRKEDKGADLYHCINFHTDWIPHFLYLCSQGKPIVWGPIGHHEMTPLRYLVNYKYHYINIITEIIRSGIKNTSWRLSPLLSKAIKTSYILPMNNECIRINRLETHESLGWTKIKSVASEKGQNYDRLLDLETSQNEKPVEIVFVGRFIPMKGPSIVIETFNKLVNSEEFVSKDLEAELTLIGTGPFENKYRKQAIGSSAGNKIKFIRWMDHDQLKTKLCEYDILFFPSFEGAGMIVIEAMLAGCVCVTLDNSGPGETIGKTGYKIKIGNDYSIMTSKFRDIILKLCADRKLLEFKKKESEDYAKKYHLWNNRQEELKRVYDKLVKKN